MNGPEPTLIALSMNRQQACLVTTALQIYKAHCADEEHFNVDHLLEELYGAIRLLPPMDEEEKS